MDNTYYLKKAIELAQTSLDKGSVPIGALIVDINGNILAQGFNEIKISNDPTAHGEVVCMRQAKEKILTKFNQEPTFLFTTLEPCFACGFFITRTNIKNVIWALDDPYKGGIDYLKNTEKLKNDFKNINLVSEPNLEIKNMSKELMKTYYLKKGDLKVAELFS